MSVEFKLFTKEERAKLKADNFGDPKRRLFPIMTVLDAQAAPKRLKRLEGAEEIKQNIIKICNRKGIPVPEEWQTEVSISESPEEKQ